MKTIQQKTQVEPDHYRYCDNCSKEVLVRLPLYIYSPKGEAVLVGYVNKCLNCWKNYEFIWIKTIDRYSSQRVRELLIRANQGKYTRALTEAEVCSPKLFEVNPETDTDFSSYQQKFKKLLDSYNGAFK